MMSQNSFRGEVIDGRYHLQEELGRGGFGLVYAAVEETLDQAISRCAVKLILPQDSEHLATITREIQALARLSHPNVLAYRTSGVERTGRFRDWVFVVTELAERSLEAAIRSGTPVDLPTLRQMTRDVASGLNYIHRQRAIHRDIKPGNILLVNGTWKISDFGLARPFDETLIQGSFACGTLPYMAPEAFRAEVGPATDIYALGITLLQAHTGRLAPRGDAPAAIPPNLQEPWLQIISRCLERHPARRCTAGEILALLDGTGTGVASSTRAAGSARGGSGRTGGSRSGGQNGGGANTNGSTRTARGASTVRTPFSSRPSVATAAVPVSQQAAPTAPGGIYRPWPWLVALIAAGIWIGWPKPPTSTSRPGSGSASSVKEPTLSAAELSYQDRDYSQAEAIAAALTQRNAQDGAAWRLRGAVSLARSRAGEAEQRYRRALDVDSSDVEAWLGYGQCLEDQGKRGEAHRAYRLALDYAGDNGELRAVAREGLRRTR